MSSGSSEDRPWSEAKRVVVDAMNVIGTTPDGWWRDRDGAALRLIDRLARFAAREDIAVTVVLDGRPLRDAPECDREGVEVLYARRPGRNAADDRIAEYVATLRDPQRTVVVTSDRGLVTRVREAGVSTTGARVFLSWLAEPSGGPPGSPSR